MKQLLLVIGVLLLSGCQHLFEYHPYDARFTGAKNINRQNIGRIEKNCRDKDTIRVAFISDSHGWFSDLKRAVSSVNKQEKVDFVVHLGDLTDCGTTREYERTRDLLQDLRVPYIAMIGNHDYLGTGDEVFDVMFGGMDFSFIAGRVKFICLNTNATEYDYIAAVPNFDFMEEEITAHNDDFDATVVCMHACPYSDQFNNNVAKAFNHYMTLFKNLHFAACGHGHSFEINDIYNNGIIYYMADSVAHGSYLLFTITPTYYAYELIHF